MNTSLHYATNTHIAMAKCIYQTLSSVSYLKRLLLCLVINLQHSLSHPNVCLTNTKSAQLFNRIKHTTTTQNVALLNTLTAHARASCFKETNHEHRPLRTCVAICNTNINFYAICKTCLQHAASNNNYPRRILMTNEKLIAIKILTVFTLISIALEVLI